MEFQYKVVILLLINWKKHVRVCLASATESSENQRDDAKNEDTETLPNAANFPAHHLSDEQIKIISTFIKTRRIKILQSDLANNVLTLVSCEDSNIKFELNIANDRIQAVLGDYFYGLCHFMSWKCNVSIPCMRSTSIMDRDDLDLIEWLEGYENYHSVSARGWFTCDEKNPRCVKTTLQKLLKNHGDGVMTVQPESLKSNEFVTILAVLLATGNNSESVIADLTSFTNKLRYFGSAKDIRGTSNVPSFRPNFRPVDICVQSDGDDPDIYSIPVDEAEVITLLGIAGRPLCEINDWNSFTEDIVNEIATHFQKFPQLTYLQRTSKLPTLEDIKSYIRCDVFETAIRREKPCEPDTKLTAEIYKGTTAFLNLYDPLGTTLAYLQNRQGNCNWERVFSRVVGNSFPEAIKDHLLYGDMDVELFLEKDDKNNFNVNIFMTCDQNEDGDVNLDSEKSFYVTSTTIYCSGKESEKTPTDLITTIDSVGFHIDPNGELRVRKSDALYQLIMAYISHYYLGNADHPFFFTCDKYEEMIKGSKIKEKAPSCDHGATDAAGIIRKPEEQLRKSETGRSINEDSQVRVSVESDFESMTPPRILPRTERSSQKENDIGSSTPSMSSSQKQENVISQTEEESDLAATLDKTATHSLQTPDEHTRTKGSDHSHRKGSNSSNTATPNKPPPKTPPPSKPIPNTPPPKTPPPSKPIPNTPNNDSNPTNSTTCNLWDNSKTKIVVGSAGVVGMLTMGIVLTILKLKHKKRQSLQTLGRVTFESNGSHLDCTIHFREATARKERANCSNLSVFQGSAFNKLVIRYRESRMLFHHVSSLKEFIRYKKKAPIDREEIINIPSDYIPEDSLIRIGTVSTGDELCLSEPIIQLNFHKNDSLASSGNRANYVDEAIDDVSEKVTSTENSDDNSLSVF